MRKAIRQPFFVCFVYFVVHHIRWLKINKLGNIQVNSSNIMKTMDRRSFLKNSALATASLSLLPTLGRSQSVKGRVRGANEDIRVAVVGFNGRGKSHISGFRDLKGVRVVALCDVDQSVLVLRCFRWSRWVVLGHDT